MCLMYSKQTSNVPRIQECEDCSNGKNVIELWKGRHLDDLWSYWTSGAERILLEFHFDETRYNIYNYHANIC
jgi:hypothetical protein